MAASRSGVIERSPEPLLPLVTITYVTSQPSLTSLATVPPVPNSESSGCAVTTSARSILSAMNSPLSRGTLEGFPFSTRGPKFETVRSSIPIQAARRVIIARNGRAPRPRVGDRRAARAARGRARAGAGAGRARRRPHRRGQPPLVVRRPGRAARRHRPRRRPPRARRAVSAVAAWLQPALVVALAFRVAAGAPDAPWLALAALVAPLVALLAWARPPARNPVTG